MLNPLLPLISGRKIAHHEPHQIVPQAAGTPRWTLCSALWLTNAAGFQSTIRKSDSTMNDHRDFLAFAWYGNLGALLLGIGLLGVLIHRKSIRRWLSAFVGLLGILFLCEGGALFHGAMLSLRGSIVGALLTVVASVALVRSLKLTGAATRKSP